MVTSLAVVASSCVYLARVSVDVNGAQYAVDIELSGVSGDGRYVLMNSLDPLVAADTNTSRDLYRKDMVTGSVELVSVLTTGVAGGAFDDATVSDDGRFVAFGSVGSSFVAGDGNGAADVFVRDMVNQATTRVSLDDAGAEVAAGSFAAQISGDGTVISWRSAGAFVGGQSNGFSQVYRRELPSGTTALVSVSTAGAMGDADSFGATVDFDGSTIAFESESTNLVAGDANGVEDVFVRLDTGLTARASTAQGGAEANGASSYPSLSGSGKFVAFQSSASNLIGSDSNGRVDVFVKSLTGGIVRASVTGTGGELSDNSLFPSMNGDGTAVLFISAATELNGGFGSQVAHVRDLDQGSTTPASVSSTGDLLHLGSTPLARLSADGNYAAFSLDDFAGPVVAGDTNGTEDVFLRWWAVPEMTSVSPSTLALGAIQPVTITGTGFRGGGAETKLYVHIGGLDGITFSNIVVVSDTEITADVETVVGLTPVGSKLLWLENPGTGPGQLGGALVNCACLSVSP